MGYNFSTNTVSRKNKQWQHFFFTFHTTPIVADHDHPAHSKN
jgi:hypothetical protein